MAITLLNLFLIGLVIGCGIVVPKLIVELYREKKAKKDKEAAELAEAAKMFEARIALKPKYMSSRHAVGLAPVSFEDYNEDKD